MLTRAGLVLVLLLLPAVAAQSGGTVRNVEPTIVAFSRTSAGAAVVGMADEFGFEVRDGNGESDVVVLRLAYTGGGGGGLERALVPADLAQVAEPAAFVSGWKVWDPAPGDGRLLAKARLVYAASGALEVEAGVRDESVWQRSSAQIPVTATPAGGSGGRGGGSGGGGGGNGGGGGGDGSRASGQDGGTSAIDPGQDAGGQPDGEGDPEGAMQGPDATMEAGPELDADAFDLTASLEVRRMGGANALRWGEVQGAMGYLVWRSTSPWVLLADVPGGLTDFTDVEAPPGAKYKVTVYTALDEAHGFITDGARLEAVQGWKADVYEVPTSGSSAGSRGPLRGRTIELALLAASVLVAVGLAARRVPVGPWVGRLRALVPLAARQRMVRSGGLPESELPPPGVYAGDTAPAGVSVPPDVEAASDPFRAPAIDPVDFGEALTERAPPQPPRPRPAHEPPAGDRPAHEPPAGDRPAREPPAQDPPRGIVDGPSARLPPGSELVAGPTVDFEDRLATPDVKRLTEALAADLAKEWDAAEVVRDRRAPDPARPLGPRAKP